MFRCMRFRDLLSFEPLRPACQRRRFQKARHFCCARYDRELARMGTRSRTFFHFLNAFLASSVNNPCRFPLKSLHCNITLFGCWVSLPTYASSSLQFSVLLVGRKVCEGQSSLCASELFVRSIFLWVLHVVWWLLLLRILTIIFLISSHVLKYVKQFARINSLYVKMWRFNPGPSFLIDYKVCNPLP